MNNECFEVFIVPFLKADDSVCNTRSIICHENTLFQQIILVIKEVCHCQIQRLKFLLHKQKITMVMLVKGRLVKDWLNFIKKK